MKTCENCGCRIYNSRCVNCHEELYIADQYYEEGMECRWSASFSKKVEEQQKEVSRIRLKNNEKES